jgi:hypothetical protein
MRIVTPFRQFTRSPALSPSAGGGLATDTWNPADKSANIVLSNGNLTATWGTSGSQSVRSITAHSTGKYHIEFTVSFTTANLLLGLMPAAQALSTYCGGAATSVGINVNQNYYFNAGASVLTGSAAVSTGHVIALEFDLDGMNFYYKNFTLSEARLGPFSIAGLTTGPWFLACSIFDTGGAFTLNTGATAYSVTPTSGYGNW